MECAHLPAERSATGFRRWLWMYAPESASAQELQAFGAADRYSAADIALLANQEAFHSAGWTYGGVVHPSHAPRIDSGRWSRPPALADEP